MLLALASVVFLGSESLSTCDHILLSQIWDFPFRRLLRLAGSRWRYSTPTRVVLHSLRADRTENPVPLLVSTDRTENISRGSNCCVRNITLRTSHVTPTKWVYWRADRRLAASYKHS
jgi:hypothetical protein